MTTNQYDKNILMRWPALGEHVRIGLHEKEAPTICGAIWEALPFQSIQGHALISGEMIFATTPVSCMVRENVKLLDTLPPGACFYGSSSQNICIIYGSLTEPEGHNIWAQVLPDDLRAVERVGKAVWANLMRPWSIDRTLPNTRQHILVEYSAL